MKCPHCTGEINVSQDARVAEAAHDEQKLDIVITCPHCSSVYNAFVDIDEDMLPLFDD